MNTNAPLHISLQVEGTSGTQPVEVEALGDDRYKILYSPGFVEGIAAGDIIRLIDQRAGEFDVLERGGNVAVKIVATKEAGKLSLAHIDSVLSPLGARRDGSIGTAAVYTIPVKVGFLAIEAALAAVQEFPEVNGWWYGNVYGPDDEPLNWW